MGSSTPTAFRVVAISLVVRFITTPPLYESLIFSPPTNSTASTIKHKLIFNVRFCLFQALVSREQFYTRLESLKDPLMFTELYYCGGSSFGGLDSLMLNGFSDEGIEPSFV